MELSSVCKPVTLTGLELLRLSAPRIIEWFLSVGGLRKPTPPPSRNDLIRERHTAGESLSDLARAFGISPQRAYQIVNFKRK